MSFYYPQLNLGRLYRIINSVASIIQRSAAVVPYQINQYYYSRIINYVAFTMQGSAVVVLCKMKRSYFLFYHISQSKLTYL